MNATDLRLDYFQIYDVLNKEVNYLIKTRGQFDQRDIECRLTALNCLAVPVSKNKEPFYNKIDKLVLYNSFQKILDPRHRVTIENQFGKQDIIIGRAVGFLAPTLSAVSTEISSKLDHFKIYTILWFSQPANKEVTLIDQFGESKTTVLYPHAFAVPVAKTYLQRKFSILNAKAHLTIYRIAPRDEKQRIVVRDQFIRGYVSITQSVLLAVPTAKIKLE